MAEKPRTLRLKMNWENAKKFEDTLSPEELRKYNHEQIKEIYRSLWKQWEKAALDAGKTRKVAWQSFQKEHGILLIADQEKAWGTGRYFKARFLKDDPTYRFNTSGAVSEQSRVWFDNFLSQATDGKYFTTEHGKHLSINDFDQQFKEYHHIHGLAEGGVVAKPTIIEYLEGDRLKAQEEFRTASKVWRKQGLILGSKVENMIALPKWQHTGKGGGAHRKVAERLTDAAVKMKDGTVIYAPPDIAELLEKGGKELSPLEARKLILPSGASGLKQKQMVETLAKVEGMPASALDYTRRIFPKGRKSGQWLGPADATLNPDLYTRFEAYGDLAILSDEQRVEGIFSALVDTDTVKPGTLKAAKDLKKLKQNKAKVKNLLKQGYTEEDFLRMDSLQNLIQRPDYADLVDQAAIDRFNKFHDPAEELARKLYGTTEFKAVMPIPGAETVWNMGHAGRVRQVRELQNLRTPLKYSQGLTTAGKLARKAGTLMPFVGAGFDYMDMRDRERIAQEDPTFLNNLQLQLSRGTLATSFWNEPVNIAAGLTNLGIDAVRTVVEEDKRAEALGMLRALGSGTGKALGLFKNIRY